MRFDVKAIFELSNELPQSAESYLEELVDEANKTLLKKGCPKGREDEASEVKSYSVKGNTISMRIVSGRYVRAHHAVKRMKNFLAKNLGVKFRAGIRSVKAKQFKITYELEEEPEGEIRLPFVSKIEIKGKTVNLKLEELDEAMLEGGAADRILSLLDEKIQRQKYGGKAEHWELIWQSEKREPVWNMDPTQEMIKLGWVNRFLPGVWYHSFTSTKIMRAMEQICLDEILNPMSFNEVMIPKVTPLHVWLKTGHMPGSAHQFYYVSEPSSWDPKSWEDLADYVKVTGEIPEDMLKSKLKPPFGGACFAQCPPLYYMFRKKSIAEEELPLKFFDRSGTSYRYEAGGLHGIERDTEFHRLEIVWFGTVQQTTDLKNQLLERFKHIFNDVLELEWRLAKVTPWYMAQAGVEGVEGVAELGTIDFEGWLPWKGDREKGEWLEFQNLTIAGTKFSDAWQFNTSSGKQVWTGCAGIGFERWMAVFLGQKGIQPSGWPRRFRERFGELPKEVRTQGI